MCEMRRERASYVSLTVPPDARAAGRARTEAGAATRIGAGCSMPLPCLVPAADTAMGGRRFHFHSRWLVHPQRHREKTQVLEREGSRTEPGCNYRSASRDTASRR